MAPRYVFPVVTQHRRVTPVARGHTFYESRGRADEANAPSASYLQQCTR